MSRSMLAARCLLACLLAIGAAASLVTSALAHAELASSSPAANASVATAPETLTLTFTEAVDPASVNVELLDTQQRPVEGVGRADVSDDGMAAAIDLPALEPNVYTVTYQVVSTVDGHATAGSFAFLVDPTGAAPPPTGSSEATSPSVDGLTVAARWLGLASMLVAFGSLSLWWFAGRRALADHGSRAAGPPWILVGMASGLAAVGVAAYLALAARPLATEVGTGMPLDVAAPFGWTPFAIAMRVAFITALLVTALSVAAAVRRRRGIGAALAAAALLAVGLGGMSMAAHAAAAGGPLFGMVDWLHLLAAAAWLGALPATFVLARRAPSARRAELAGILRRHGSVAIVAAPLVALTGIANSPLVLGSARDVVASDYGNLLLAKVLLLCVAIGIGAVNHLALRGRGRARITFLVGVEASVAILAVATAATMVTIQPASTRQPELIAPPLSTAHLFGEVGPSRVHASVSLPAPGNQSYRVTVEDAETGIPRDDVQKVFLTFLPPPDAAIEPTRVELVPDEREELAGLYAVSGAYTPFVGDWGLEVTVRRSGERDESTTFELPVRSIPVPEVGPPPDTGVGVPAPIGAVWGVLPPGALGWLPGLLALVAVILLGRLPASRLRSVARGAMVGVLVIATAAAGTRSLVTAANAPAPADLGRQPAASDGIVERGEALYLANCASCHGQIDDGRGAVATLPDAGPLAGAVTEATDAQLSYRIAYGIAGTPMPAFAGLITPDERADLVAYLRARVDGD